MPTEQQTETRREIAEKIAEISFYRPWTVNQLVTAIEAALKDRDERAARIIEKRILDLKSVTHPTNHNTWEQLDLADLAVAIRNEDHK